MKFAKLKQNWDCLGVTDPMWAILSRPDMRGGRWDEAAFFETGQREIAHVMKTLEARGWSTDRQRALDFGCGLGRLTQALCTYFAHVDGIDIAASMIDGARRLNRFDDQCTYHLNERDDLRLFDDNTFDFIYSNIVLQHMRPKYAERYVREFVRVLKPGGMVWFQLPSHQAPPPQTAPLSDNAFHAELTAPLNKIALRVGETHPLSIMVRNASAVAWPSTGETLGHRDVALGNHWWRQDGSVLQFDDQRCPLPVRLDPGDEIELVMMISAPPEPGIYRLELDMVQESIAWFAHRGSHALSIPVAVAGSLAVEVAEHPPVKGTTHIEDEETRDQDEDAENQIEDDEVEDLTEDEDAENQIEDDEVEDLTEAPTLSPRIEMYGTKPQHVLAWIDKAGGRLIQATEDHAAGDGWYSFHYLVTR